MAKDKISYTCSSCGAKSFQWRGNCSMCGAWDTLSEEKEIKKTPKNSSLKHIPLSQIASDLPQRIKLNISEFDRVLGGGAVQGSAILLAGDPGIGKSTIMLQAANSAAKNSKTKVLYFAGEENPSQIAMRAERVGVSCDMMICSGANPDEIANNILSEKPEIAIIDSIQSLTNSGFSMGTPSQLREAVSAIIPAVKESNTTCFFIGHVTKEGIIAGPKSIEHMVDVIVSFEGEKGYPYRLLRSTKNRFGPTDEIGVFTMNEKGLNEVPDPSKLFLSARPESAAGSVVVPALNGTRPLLVEVQALVSKSSLAYPRRTALGIDTNRLSLLSAVLEKSGGVSLFDQDVFINIAGGITLKEPAADLGIASAIYSSFISKPVSPQTAFIGELGLSGEIRAVQNIERRLKETAKMGFKKAIVPEANSETFSGLELIKIKNISDLLEYISK